MTNCAKLKPVHPFMYMKMKFGSTFVIKIHMNRHTNIQGGCVTEDMHSYFAFDVDVRCVEY